MEDITREVAEKDGLMTVEEAVRTVFDAIQPRDPSKWWRCEGMKRRITLEDVLQSMDPCLMMTLLADYQTLHAVLYDEKGNPILGVFCTAVSSGNSYSPHPITLLSEVLSLSLVKLFHSP